MCIRDRVCAEFTYTGLHPNLHVQVYIEKQTHGEGPTLEETFFRRAHFVTSSPRVVVRVRVRAGGGSGRRRAGGGRLALLVRRLDGVHPTSKASTQTTCIRTTLLTVPPLLYSLSEKGIHEVTARRFCLVAADHPLVSAISENAERLQMDGISMMPEGLVKSESTSS